MIGGREVREGGKGGEGGEGREEGREGESYDGMVGGQGTMTVRIGVQSAIVSHIRVVIVAPLSSTNRFYKLDKNTPRSTLRTSIPPYIAPFPVKQFKLRSHKHGRQFT